ncbi:MAG TPA: hypothetical protein VFW34_01415 [Candidatus Rubrimentiphilum sp.]|nr:hypothetical protein [Candidatus Rubrimentiphilum sp.]
MLANALVCVALMALAANTILSAGLISSRLAVRRAAQTYVNREYQRAAQALISEIAPFARSGAFPDPLPAFTFAPACVDERDPCGFTASAAVGAQFGDSDSPAPCDTLWACANNEQRNGYVAERRIVATISVAVQAGDGSVLATREADLTLRTLNAPPYVAIAGARDRTTGAFPGDGFPPGEDAGRPPATANPCQAGSPGTSDDTVVRVAYENAQNGACSDASTWRSSAYSNRGGFDLAR